MKAVAILGILVASMVPVYFLYKYLQRAMRPRESGKKFLLWLLAVFALIFTYTFLLVLLVRLLFPGA